MTTLHPSTAPGIEHAGEAEAPRHGPRTVEHAEHEGVAILVRIARHQLEESLAAAEQEGAWRSAA